MICVFLGENGTISYSLFDYEDYFSINPSTGEIDCIKSIDREEFSSIELHIIASDQGTHPQYQSICTTLHITLNDLNDNTPQFLSSNFIFHLFSDMPRYSIFGQLSAIDYDQHDQLIYSLSPNPYVTINKYTGHLRLKHHLHRLIDQILNVTVYVTDGQHRNQTILQIFIRAFPDAQEPILLPEPAFALTVNESIPIGTIISNIYRRFQLVSSTIDLIEIVHDEQRKLPVSIDQQGKNKTERIRTPVIIDWILSSHIIFSLKVRCHNNTDTSLYLSSQDNETTIRMSVCMHARDYWWWTSLYSQF